MRTYKLYSWKRPCWRCDEPTPRVIATTDEFEFHPVELEYSLGIEITKRCPYLQHKRGKWENWCLHCDALQGDFYVQTEEWFVEIASQFNSVQEIVENGIVIYEGEIIQ